MLRAEWDFRVSRRCGRAAMPWASKTVVGDFISLRASLLIIRLWIGIITLTLTHSGICRKRARGFYAFALSLIPYVSRDTLSLLGTLYLYPNTLIIDSLSRGRVCRLAKHFLSRAGLHGCGTVEGQCTHPGILQVLTN